jgi:hypothetical protein
LCRSMWFFSRGFAPEFAGTAFECSE